MHLNKKDGFTLGFVLIAAFAVLLNGFLKHQPDGPVKLAESSAIEKSYPYPLDIKSSNIGIMLEGNPGSISVDKPTPTSFAEAFSEARNTRGPGAIFEWNGQSYTTSFAEEIVKPGEKLDSTQINIVLNQIPEK